jgi:hypothetical protein
MSMETATVGELSTQLRGVTYEKSEASRDPLPGYLGVARAGNIINGDFVTHDLIYVPGSRVSDKQILRAGDVLIAASSGSLEVVGKAMCPRLHVDRVGVRLLCTYRGPGTEWVDDASVDRHFLGAASGGQPDETSGLLLAGHRVEVIPPFAVALLKGSLWQGNDGRGIVHRSPGIAAEQAPRVLLAMDAGWE